MRQSTKLRSLADWAEENGSPFPGGEGNDLFMNFLESFLSEVPEGRQSAYRHYIEDESPRKVEGQIIKEDRSWHNNTKFARDAFAAVCGLIANSPQVVITLVKAYHGEEILDAQ